MYTQVDFGKKLKEKVSVREERSEIGLWAHEIYMEHILGMDLGFVSLLLTLNSMEMGPEFYLSYERLNEIADDLIAGKKEINLDY